MARVPGQLCGKLLSRHPGVAGRCLDALEDGTKMENRLSSSAPTGPGA